VAKIDKPAGDISRQDTIKFRRRVQMNGWKGQPYFQAWPRQRGRPTSPLQIAWIQAFTQRARLLKSPDPKTLIAAQSWSAGTGWYYRDVLERASYGKLIVYGEAIRVTTPTVSVNRSGTQSVGLNTNVPISFTAQEWDNNNFWDLSTNPTRLTVRSAGLYLVCGQIGYTDASASGIRYIFFRKNGTTEYANVALPSGVTNTKELTTVGLIWLAANDYLELIARSSVNTTVFSRAFALVGITPEAMMP